MIPLLSLSNCEFIDCFGSLFALLPLSLGDRKYVEKGKGKSPK